MQHTQCRWFTHARRRTDIYLDFDLVEGLSVVNTYQGSNHLRENDCVTKVCANRLRLLPRSSVLLLHNGTQQIISQDDAALSCAGQTWTGGEPLNKARTYSLTKAVHKTNILSAVVFPEKPAEQLIRQPLYTGRADRSYSDSSMLCGTSTRPHGIGTHLRRARAWKRSRRESS